MGLRMRVHTPARGPGRYAPACMLCACSPRALAAAACSRIESPHAASHRCMQHAPLHAARHRCMQLVTAAAPAPAPHLVAIVEDGHVVALGDQLLCQVVADEGVAAALWREGVGTAGSAERAGRIGAGRLPLRRVRWRSGAPRYAQAPRGAARRPLAQAAPQPAYAKVRASSDNQGRLGGNGCRWARQRASRQARASHGWPSRARGSHRTLVLTIRHLSARTLTVTRREALTRTARLAPAESCILVAIWGLWGGPVRLLGRREGAGGAAAGPRPETRGAAAGARCARCASGNAPTAALLLSALLSLAR